jgi:hypothetical protein
MKNSPYKLHKLRKAIAMIELIFAIVILGIVMMSAPMLISTASKSSQVSFQQESIAILATHANELMSYAWDESNTYDAGPSRFNILETASSETELDRDTLISGRERNVAVTTYNSVNAANFGAGVDTNASGSVEPSKDDIDDFDSTIYSLRLIIDSTSNENTSDEGEYMDTNITITTDITYGDDAPASTYLACKVGCAYSEPFSAARNTINTTNIKRIISKIQSADTDTEIILKSFMCNIGAIQIHSKSNL